jgi:hypothetical protein
MNCGVSVAVTLALSVTVHAQGVWERLADFPIETFEVAAAALDGKVYTVASHSIGRPCFGLSPTEGRILVALSHDTTLAVYGTPDANPAHIHLTVPKISSASPRASEEHRSPP